MRRFLFSVALIGLAVMASSAIAADIRSANKNDPNPPLTFYNWAGPSTWLSLGFVDAKAGNTVDATTPKLKSYGWGWSKYYKLVNAPTNAAIDNTIKGFLLGGGAAYDWYAFNGMLLGIEGDLYYSTASNSTNVGTAEFSRQMNMLGFIGPRLVVPFGQRAALIAKVGGAVGHFTQNYTGAALASASQTLWGWGAGGGFQYIVDPKDKLFVKGEATFSGFKGQTIDGSGVSVRNNVIVGLISFGKNW